MNDRLVITCEHAGNVVPPKYAPLFVGHEALLPTHRGWDPGALLLAREMAERFAAPLYFDETTRLLADLNRSIGNPELHSEATRHLTLRERRELLDAHYHPHRRRVDAAMADAVATGDRVVHIASHSFTPELNGHVRTADIGMLYDPGRPGEVAFATAWIDALRTRRPDAQAAPQLSLHRQERRRDADHAPQVPARALRRHRARGQPALRRGRRTGVAEAPTNARRHPRRRRFSCAAEPVPTRDRPAAPARPDSRPERDSCPAPDSWPARDTALPGRLAARAGPGCCRR